MTLRMRISTVLTLALFWIALTSCGGDPSGTSDASGASGAPAATASPERTETPESSETSEDNHGANGSPKNVVQVVNKSSKKLRMKANVQLNRIKGDSVTPLNAAVAVGENCTGCQTFAVALQLDLYVKGAHVVSPENYAIALNVACTSCVTVAHAIQFALPVLDPENDADESGQQGDAKKLLKRMEQELDAIAKTDGITADQAETRIEVVLAEFRALANAMRDDVKRTVEQNSPSPTPTASPSSSQSSTPNGSPTGGAIPAPTTAPPASITPSPSPSPTP
jgi:hypothetical protein